MEKKQYDLFIEIMRRLGRTGVLDDLILIGSWCIYLYKDYFAGMPFIDHTVLKTRDMDFLIKDPFRIKNEVNIPELMKDLGFVTQFLGAEGHVRLDHPDLILEFLTVEKGKGRDKPFAVPKLGVRAVALRFLSMLTDNLIKVRIEDFLVTTPHPINFALHKLIVFQRRVKEEKALKDRGSAVGLLNALIDKGESSRIRDVYNSLPRKWQNKIAEGLNKAEERVILKLLTG